MSAGRDVRGIKRGYQFDKVEMYKFTTLEISYEHLDILVKHATDICEALEIPYRRIEMVTGDSASPRPRNTTSRYGRPDVKSG